MIYIPLWSYSNFTFIVVTFCSIIFTFHYGPIQIYLIIIFAIMLNLFTFHYGPIQMIQIHLIRKEKYAFTFHYGPIQIKEEKEVYAVAIDLHSTMVLFK